METRNAEYLRKKRILNCLFENLWSDSDLETKANTSVQENGEKVHIFLILYVHVVHVKHIDASSVQIICNCNAFSFLSCISEDHAPNYRFPEITNDVHPIDQRFHFHK